MNDDTDLEDAKEEAWCAAEREKVMVYLQTQNCHHAGVGERPAFHIDPYIALWAVQSPTHPGRIGWWALSGDCPTDYMSSASGYHPRDALRYFSSEWLRASDAMKRGESYEGVKIGRPELWPKMAPLLRTRAEILRKYAEDDDWWDDA